MKITSFATALILIIGMSSNVSAIYLHGFTTLNPVVGGLPMSCTSYDGQQVTIISNHFLNDVGYASIAQNGQRIIQLNPKAISHWPPIVRQFWFSHECAHHMLYPNSNSEKNADCVAIKALFNLGELNNNQQIQQLSQKIISLPGTNKGHLPGPDRLRHMLTCMN